MTKKEKDKQTNNSTWDRKLETKQQEPHKKLGVISCALEEKADPA